MNSLDVNVEKLIEFLDMLITGLQKGAVTDMNVEINTEKYDPYSMKSLIQTVKIEFKLEI